jgi:hypothetical protein
LFWVAGLSLLPGAGKMIFLPKECGLDFSSYIRSDIFYT